MQGYTGALHVGEAVSSMQGTENSVTCIKGGACLPLGAHSVLATLPRVPVSRIPPPEADLPIILVLAGMHANGLFHELIQVGACAEIIGVCKLAGARAAAAGFHHSCEQSLQTEAAPCSPAWTDCHLTALESTGT